MKPAQYSYFIVEEILQVCHKTKNEEQIETRNIIITKQEILWKRFTISNLWYLLLQYMRSYFQESQGPLTSSYIA